jgi:exodeoxyribonuclease V alpha subunit
MLAPRIPNRFGFDPIRDIQALCPMNRGGVGARSLNIELQVALNPAGDRKVERFGWTLAPRQGHADRERLRQGGL